MYKRYFFRCHSKHQIRTLQRRLILFWWLIVYTTDPKPIMIEKEFTSFFKIVYEEYLLTVRSQMEYKMEVVSEMLRMVSSVIVIILWAGACIVKKSTLNQLSDVTLAVKIRHDIKRNGITGDKYINN